MEYPHPPAQPAAVQPTAPASVVSASPHDPDEINLLEYVYALVRHKKLIIVLTLFGLVSGYVAALIKGPTWVAEAVIAPKEAESQKTPSFAGLGALGGIVANQFGLFGAPGLDRIEQILKSQRFHSEVVSKYNFLPKIYKLENPRIYRKMYDEGTGTWKPDFNKPEALLIGGFLRQTYLRLQNDGARILKIKIKSKDSLFTYQLIQAQLNYLNIFIREVIQTEAQNNVAFLDEELPKTADPLLREKIYQLISSELERSMLVSKEGFRIDDPPVVGKDYKTKKILPIIFSLGLFLLATLFISFQWAISIASRRERDRQTLLLIKRGLRDWRT